MRHPATCRSRILQRGVLGFGRASRPKEMRLDAAPRAPLDLFMSANWDPPCRAPRGGGTPEEGWR